MAVFRSKIGSIYLLMLVVLAWYITYVVLVCMRAPVPVPLWLVMLISLVGAGKAIVESGPAIWVWWALVLGWLAVRAIPATRWRVYPKMPPLAGLPLTPFASLRKREPLPVAWIELDWLEKLLYATLIGTLPHVIFLLLIHSELVDPYLLAGPLKRYEDLAFELKDHIEPWVSPPFFLAVVMSFVVVFFPPRIKSHRFYKAATKRVEQFKLGALTVLAAASFTAFSSAPAGRWQPESSASLKLVLEATTREESRYLILSKLARGDADVADLAQKIGHMTGRVKEAEKEHLNNRIGGGTRTSFTFNSILEDHIAQYVQESAPRLNVSLIALPEGSPSTRAVQRALAVDLERARLKIREKYDPRSEKLSDVLVKVSASAAGALSERLIGKVGGAYVEAATERATAYFLSSTRTLDSFRDLFSGSKQNLEPVGLISVDTGIDPEHSGIESAEDRMFTEAKRAATKGAASEDSSGDDTEAKHGVP